MFCNGICAICPNHCYIGEVKNEISPELEAKLSEVFDKNKIHKTKNNSNETGLVVYEDAGTYEVKRSVFGKEKVRKVK